MHVFTTKLRTLATVFFAAAFIFVLLQSFDVISNSNKRKVDGTEPGYTGSPGDDYKNCTVCHGGTATNVEGWVTSNIPEDGFVPGQTYTITATNYEIGATRFGFSISPQAINGDLLGEMIITDTLQTKLVGSNKYITYRKDGIEGQDLKTWTFDWKAPADTIQEVVFYGAFNSNHDGHKDGDKTYLNQYRVYRQGFANINQANHSENAIDVYPNPANNNLNIEFEVKENSNIQINLLGLNGQTISVLYNNNFSAGLFSNNFSLLDISGGVYIVQVKTETKIIYRRIVITR